MKIETIRKKIRYILSNENIRNGDYTYPIGRGRCTDDGGWILNEIDFKDFPFHPHKILDTKNDKYKPYQVHTDKGYGPIEMYFKIIKKEKKKEGKRLFESSTWVEIKDKDYETTKSY